MEVKSKAQNENDLRRKAQQTMKELHPDYPGSKDGRINWTKAFQYLKAKGLVSA
jgi:hypothetical protein